MTNDYIARTERAALDRLREEFGPMGYRIIPHPDSKELPDFVGNYRPDVLLVGPTSSIIVEMKSYPSPDDKNVRAEFFAREVPKHKGWDFMLVLLKPQSYGVVGATEIKRAIAEVRSPTPASSRKQDFVMAWAAFEAAARLAETRLDPEQDWSDLPTFAVLEKLAYLGELDDAVVRELWDLADIRNRLVHGGLDVEVPPGAVDKLLAEAKQLVEVGE